MDLKKEFESQNDLTTLLKCFGEDRKPKTLETLVFFTAKALSQYFADYLSLLKSIENEYPISDFRVGTEIHSIPFVLLLFDIAMTGATKVTDKSTLLTYLFLHSIRHKMRDYRSMTTVQKVISNEVSLA